VFFSFFLAWLWHFIENKQHKWKKVALFMLETFILHGKCARNKDFDQGKIGKIAILGLLKRI